MKDSEEGTPIFSAVTEMEPPPLYQEFQFILEPTKILSCRRSIDIEGSSIHGARVADKLGRKD
jgi:hypothetical protein